MRETNTVLLVGIGLFLLWLGVSGRLANLNAAWKVLYGGEKK